MKVTFGRILSLLIAAGYTLCWLLYGDPTETALYMLIAVLLFPLALIWFPEELGSFTGYVGHGGNIDTETPPILVSIMGWLLLVGLPAFFFFVLR